MRVGIVIGRIGGVDGVALETEKWIAVLQRMGHAVTVLTGQLEREVEGVEEATVLEELAFDHRLALEGQQMAFFGQPVAELELLAKLEAEAARIERAILGWIAQQRVDCLLVENASALPFHLTMGMALRRVYAGTGLPAVTHDHDFYWERGERYATPFAGVRRILQQCFPVRLPNVRHAVLSSAAAQALADRLGIADAVVVPNVMDFDAPFGQLEPYNADLRQDLGFADEATLLFQVTRIVARKGIETAIKLVDQLDDPQLHLVITGTSRDEPNQRYVTALHLLVYELGLQGRVHFAGERFDNRRGRTRRGRKVYSLSDAYAHATACTYFSTYEGFGNAFVEAVAARRPIFVNNYEPVYWPDIGSLGFETVMTERGELTPEAVEQIREVLRDPARRQRMVEHNFELGRKHFSFQALEQRLQQLFPA